MSDYLISPPGGTLHVLTLAKTLPRPCQAVRGLSASLRRVTSQQKQSTSGQAALLIKQSLVTFSSGAILGPFCDAQHSRYHVLEYADPYTVEIPGLDYTIQTCWWVPLLFGAAGIILGTGQPLLDEIFNEKAKDEISEPSWGRVYLCISVFIVQYWASGILGNSIPNDQLLALLASIALAQWAIFDATLQGFLLAALTSLCGPLIEIALINVGHLYSYSTPSFLGIPTWIGAVYFCGGPAVGTLGRKVWYNLRKRHQT